MMNAQAIPSTKGIDFREGNKPIRWSVKRAAAEFGRSAQFIQKGLKATGASPDGGTYSTIQIAKAIFDSSGLSSRAKDAKLEQQIIEMKTAQLKHEQLEGKVVSVLEVKDMLADGITKLITAIRTSDLAQVTKKRLIDDISKIKLDVKVIPFNH